MLLYLAALPLTSMLLCVALGLFTFTRNPRQPANIGFALCMMNLAIINSGNALVLLSSAEKQIVLMGIQISSAGQAFLPLTFLFFTLIFARGNHKVILHRWAPAFIGMGIISTLFIFYVHSPEFVTFYFYGIHNSIPPMESIQFSIGSIGRYFYIYFIMGMLLNLVQLENTLRSSQGKIRRQIKYIIFGTGGIIAFFIYFASQVLLFSIVNILTITVTSSVILISVSLMAVFIAKYRLLDVDIFISRYFIYNSFTVLVVGSYLFVVGIISQGIQHLGIPFNDLFIYIFVFISILVLCILLFAEKLRWKVQLFINKHFYKHKYEFRDKWMESIEKISSSKSIVETQTALMNMISGTMGAKEVYLWVYDSLSQTYCLSNKGIVIDHNKIEDTHPIIQLIKEKKSTFMMNEFQNNQPGSIRDFEKIEKLADAAKAVLCAPLLANQDLIGFILQGKDSSGESYRKDDFELLNAITTQTAIQIKKIKLDQDLMVAKEVEAFHKLSSFIMHDLKNLTNSLSLISQNAKENIGNPEFQNDAILTINNTVSKMKELIGRLSSVPKPLKLKKVKVNLKNFVDDVLSNICFAGSKNVTATNEVGEIPSIPIDPDAMEMVFINFLNNAYDAIDGNGVIRVKASYNEKFVQITISDNGSGMSKEFIKTSLFQPFKTTKNKGFGIGLYQCKSIIESHKGNIDVESEKGIGTTIKVKLPRVLKN